MQKTKICNNCKETKPITSFNSNGYHPGGNKKYKPFCSKCESKLIGMKYRSRVKESVLELGRKLECERCGYKESFAALDFHHITEEKNNILSKMASCSKERIKKEISLCEILCANCHRVEHSSEKK